MRLFYFLYFCKMFAFCFFCGICLRMFRKPPKPFSSWSEYKAARDSFYESPEWKSLRQKIIALSDGKCVYCGRVPTKENPINIDHRIPLWKRWDLRLCAFNLQFTCEDCNKKKNGNSHKKMLVAMGLVQKKRNKITRSEKRKKKQARALATEQRKKQEDALFWKDYLKNV